MRTGILIFLVAVVLPLTSSFITYTFILLGNNALEVDDTGALIIIIILTKVLFISTFGILPINMNEVVKSYLFRRERSLNENLVNNTTNLYQVPKVEEMPCARRFLCEFETAAKTSDNYLDSGPAVIGDRNLEEEVAPEEVDPIHELQIEAIRALFRENDNRGELSQRGMKALKVMQGLTGKACEEAYRLCPGRFTAASLYRSLFNEMKLYVLDHY